MKTLYNKKYQICTETFEQQLTMFWTPKEFSMQKDILDFKAANPSLKSVVSDILSYFVQSDVEIAETYGKLYPCFFNVNDYPEIQMMFSTIACMEAIHVWAYSFLFESLNLDGRIYRNFENYEREAGRLSNLNSVKIELRENKNFFRDNLLNIIKCVLFGEGVMLYGMFALLLSLSDDGLFPNMGSIVAFSIRDENLHVEAMSKFIKSYAKQEHNIDIMIYSNLLNEYSKMIMHLELQWINALKLTITESDLPKQLVATLYKLESYYTYLIQQRLSFFLIGEYQSIKCPLAFMDTMADHKSYDFLKTPSTEYAKVKITPDDYDF
ncbi:MAG: ribonucleotide-diphosphate reductase subunit beta [Turicibacter sp.]